jgi:hypothetical protein
MPSLLDAYRRKKERNGSLTFFQEEGEAIGATTLAKSTHLEARTNIFSTPPSSGIKSGLACS